MEENKNFKNYAPEVFDKIIAIDTVIDLLEKGKNEYNDKIAVKKDDEDITYNKLYQDVNNVCNVLKENNIESKTNVGVISFNNYNFVKASLGTMAYGAVATLLPFQLDEKSIYGCCMKYNLKALFYDPTLEEKVIFFDYVNQKQLASLYKNAYALVYPSLAGPDSISALGALYFNCPVLISNHLGYNH